VRLWDFVFYASFGVVVTSSVRIGGVLLVFSYLIVPALAGVTLGGSIVSRLLIGWGFGTLVSVIGMVASAALDLPTGAAIVCAFGLTLIVFGIGSRWLRRGPASPL
jgi:zinc/manganese transport system permease protein